MLEMGGDKGTFHDMSTPPPPEKSAKYSGTCEEAYRPSEPWTRRKAFTSAAKDFKEAFLVAIVVRKS